MNGAADISQESPVDGAELFQPEEADTSRHAVSALVSWLVGFLTPFTLSLIGEIPVGELLLALVAGWIAVCAILNEAAPAGLLRSRILRLLLAAQAVAFGAYVVSDLWMHSAAHDMLRGWARLGFLAIDTVAIAYLLGRTPRNFIWALAGQVTGTVAATALFGALFDDGWKFGYGIPATYGVILLASLGGRWLVVLAALGLGALHFVQDFRSAGGAVLLLGAATALQMLPQQARRIALPIGVLCALGIIGGFYGWAQNAGDSHRASRSDVDRSSMMTAAAEAFVESPLIGHGSWFSRSNVYENFLMIRDEAAHEAGVGGFANANDQDIETIAFHSQLLVALAEGGLFGATFFLVFAAALLGTLGKIVMRETWHRSDPAASLYLIFAAWNLAMSPFSGAHRVYIALSVGLILLAYEEEPVREEATS